VSSTERIPAGHRVVSAEVKVDKEGQFGTGGTVTPRVGEKFRSDSVIRVPTRSHDHRRGKGSRRMIPVLQTQGMIFDALSLPALSGPSRRVSMRGDIVAPADSRGHPDCDRTVIRKARNLGKHRGLRTHTE